MVFFTCNACGQAVKKNQVEKHYTTKCRNCTVLSCIDCGKDFCGDEYQSHTKCITEDEKYGGKDFKPKQSSGKGEAKQANWIANINSYISTADLPKNLVNLLQNLMKFNNLPRKKDKFISFLKNSVRVREKFLVDEAWDVFMKANQSKEPTNAVKNNLTTSAKPLDGPKQETEETPTPVDKIEAQEPEVKKHKKKKNKIRDQEETEVRAVAVNEQESSEHESEKRRKARISGEEITGENNEIYEKKSKKKKHHKEEQEPTLLNNGSSKEEDVSRKHKKKRKHDHGDVITAEVDSSKDSAKTKIKGNMQLDDDCENVDSSDVVTVESSTGKSKKKKRNDCIENSMTEIVVKHKKKKRKHMDVQENGSQDCVY